MRSTAIALSSLRLILRSSLAARLPHFITLMKPRVMALALCDPDQADDNKGHYCFAHE